jgi:predicted Zn-dependent protease
MRMKRLLPCLLVDAPDSVNAFATPGGHIYVESGLLAAVNTEAGLAGVISHEAAHILERHPARNLVQALGLETVAALALGEDASQLQQLAAAVVAQGAFLAHSRAQEIEADELGAVISSKVGYSPTG